MSRVDLVMQLFTKHLGQGDMYGNDDDRNRNCFNHKRTHLTEFREMRCWKAEKQYLKFIVKIESYPVGIVSTMLTPCFGFKSNTAPATVPIITKINS